MYYKWYKSYRAEGCLETQFLHAVFGDKLIDRSYSHHFLVDLGFGSINHCHMLYKKSITSSSSDRRQ